MATEDARFEELGQLVCAHVPTRVRRILLYVEFDDGVVAPSLFYDLDSGALHDVISLREITEELFRLQEILGPDVKAMEFEVNGDNFSARFAYADNFDPEGDTEERTDAVLQRVFGHASGHWQQLEPGS